jgi:hypothetical protein
MVYTYLVHFRLSNVFFEPEIWWFYKGVPKSYQLLAAKRRLADEYDAAQERGEIRTQRDNQAFSGVEKASGPEVVPPKELHEARIIRDAEVADPGIVRRANPRPRTSGPAPARGGTSAGPNPSPLEVPMRAAPG